MSIVKKRFGKAGLKGFGKKGSAATGEDPLASVEYTGNVEEDSQRELSALDQAYRDRAKAEQDRFRKATDSEYWFAVCFESREEKEAFLKAIGAKTRIHGDKYLSGKALAKLLGIKY